MQPQAMNERIVRLIVDERRADAARYRGAQLATAMDGRSSRQWLGHWLVRLGQAIDPEPKTADGGGLVQEPALSR